MPEQCRNSLKIVIFAAPQVTSMAGDKISNSVRIAFSCPLCKASITSFFVVSSWTTSKYQMLTLSKEIRPALLCPHEADSESARSGSHVPQLLVLWLSNSYVYHVRGTFTISGPFLFYSMMELVDGSSMMELNSGVRKMNRDHSFFAPWSLLC